VARGWPRCTGRVACARRPGIRRRSGPNGVRIDVAHAKENHVRERSFAALAAGGFHRIAYTEWGEADNPRVLVCVHGLTRNGRDFDDLARAMADRYRVICPDVAGRGRSEWLADKSQYAYPTYCADMAALIARSGAESVDWVGTSMGGLIGMMLAAQPNAPIARMVLNDVGSLIPKASLERIGTYVGTDPVFDGRADLEAHIRKVNAAFGPLTDAQWAHLAHYSARVDEAGKTRFRYDPAIALPFKTGPLSDVDLEPVWKAVRCPVLILRGAQSDLLLADTARRMRDGRPGVELVEFPGVGHAPALMDADQIDTVRRFLLQP
jgi:pimeloyl-ACP methyl ester carboxylesterase